MTSVIHSTQLTLSVKCFQDVNLHLGWYTSQPFACLQVDNAERKLTETETLNSYMFKLFQSKVPKADVIHNWLFTIHYFIFIGCISDPFLSEKKLLEVAVLVTSISLYYLYQDGLTVTKSAIHIGSIMIVNRQLYRPEIKMKYKTWCSSIAKQVLKQWFYILGKSYLQSHRALAKVREYCSHVLNMKTQQED